jgi:hypothetical protein
MCWGDDKKKKSTSQPAQQPAPTAAPAAPAGAAAAPASAAPAPAQASQMSEIAAEGKARGGKLSGSAGGKTMLTGALGLLGDAAKKKKTLLGQ